MKEFLEHPAVQAGVAPFVVGLVVALLLGRARLGGLAAVAGFATAVGLVAGFTFSPLTATRKIVLLTLAAPIVGIVLDLAWKDARSRAWVLAALAAIAALWVFWPVLAQKPMSTALLLGATAVIVTAWLVGYSDAALATRPVECGAAALLLGLGAGVLCIFGASASLGVYAIALGAGAGGYLLVMMIMNRMLHAGATLALGAALAAGLLVSATMILAQLQWYAVAIFALTPLFARIPLGARAPIWARAVIHSVLALIPVVVAIAVAYYGSRGPSS
jgi:hypothetical protein